MIVRLFGTTCAIRIVTTNFDDHFRGATLSVFGNAPEIYRAPALPLGGEFKETTDLWHRRSQMTGHGSKLGRKLEAAIAALLTYRTVQEAAKECGIGYKTLLVG